MNWQRGLFRAWILLAVIWIVPLVGVAFSQRSSISAEAFWIGSAFIVLPPLGLLALGFALRWVLSGLRP